MSGWMDLGCQSTRSGQTWAIEKGVRLIGFSSPFPSPSPLRSSECLSETSVQTLDLIPLPPLSLLLLLPPNFTLKTDVLPKHLQAKLCVRVDGVHLCFRFQRQLRHRHLCLLRQLEQGCKSYCFLSSCFRPDRFHPPMAVVTWRGRAVEENDRR